MGDKVPWGPLLILGVCVLLIGGAGYAVFDWSQGEPEITTTTLSVQNQAVDACEGLVDGYVEYTTKAIGPPPEGWEAEAKTTCVPSALPYIEAGTSTFNDYCSGWDRGQEVARDTTGVSFDFVPCPR